jgi:BirA family transcriptional regulator, biotin operon repressor / biotin---[acetyl-CoA-carboxylase] ligase
VNPPSYPKKYSLVLGVLAEAPGKTCSLDELLIRTGLNRSIIDEAICYMQESGLDLRIGDKGICLLSLPEIILPAIIHSGLKSRVMACEIHSYKSIGSTNEVAKRLAESNAPEGTMVIAEKQTQGRGRLGRNWYSPSGTGLYFSLILRPQVSFERIPALSLVAALSVCRAMESFDGIKAEIKWPNDCLLDGKKTAGILVELSAELDRVSYAILGIGINVNNQPSDFPASIRQKVTSLAIATGVKIDRTRLLRYLLEDFEKSYNNFQRYGLRFLAPELVKKSAVIGKRVSITIGRKKITGDVLGFNNNGALRIRDKEGVKVFSAGEVSLR